MTALLDILLPYQKKFVTDGRKRKIWVASRQIGKSFAMAYALCSRALSRKNGLSLCVSTGARAAAEIIRKCGQFAEAAKIMTDGKLDYSCSFDCVKFSNGCRVLSLPSSTDGANLRGYTASCVVVDEAAFVRGLGGVLQSINPALSRDPEAELIFATTPAGKNGEFFDVYRNALNDDGWYVQTTTVFDAIADGLRVDVEKLRSLCPDPDVFDQEYCCKFLSDYGSLLDVSLLQYREPEGNCYYCGIDVGRRHDRTVIATVRRKSDEIYLDNVVTLNKTEYARQLDAIKDLNDRYRYAAGYVDRGGLGDPMAEFVSRKINARIEGWAFTSASKTPAYEYLRSLVFDRKIFFREEFRAMIEADFGNVNRIVTDDGRVKYEAGRNGDGHSDFASALVLALQAARDNPENAGCPVSFPVRTAFGRFAAI